MGKRIKQIDEIQQKFETVGISSVLKKEPNGGIQYGNISSSN